jgi:MarR family transcriptional regulator for hemolysin
MAGAGLSGEQRGHQSKRPRDLLEIEPITLGRIVDKLQAIGLIERHPDPSDRRVWLLHLTPAARPKLAQLRGLGDVTRGEALAGVSEADTERLLRTLQALKTTLRPRAIRRLRHQRE